MVVIDGRHFSPDSVEGQAEILRNTLPDRLYIEDLMARLSLLQAHVSVPNEREELEGLNRQLKAVKHELRPVIPGFTQNIEKALNREKPGREHIPSVLHPVGWPAHLEARREEMWQLQEGHIGDRALEPELWSPAALYKEVLHLKQRLENALRIGEDLAHDSTKELSPVVRNLEKAWRKNRWLETAPHPHPDEPLDLVERIGSVSPSVRYLDEFALRARRAAATAETTQLSRILNGVSDIISKYANNVCERLASSLHETAEWAPENVPASVFDELKTLAEQLLKTEQVEKSTTNLARGYSEKTPSFRTSDIVMTSGYVQETVRSIEGVDLPHIGNKLTEPDQLPSLEKLKARTVQKLALDPELALILSEELVKTTHAYGTREEMLTVRADLSEFVDNLRHSDYAWFEADESRTFVQGAAWPNALKGLRSRDTNATPLSIAELAKMGEVVCDHLAQERARLEPGTLDTSAKKLLETPDVLRKNIVEMTQTLTDRGFDTHHRPGDAIRIKTFPDSRSQTNRAERSVPPQQPSR